MATRPGDGPAEATLEASAPKDRRLPLSTVVFNQPTQVPGFPILITTVTVGEGRVMGGETYTCPQAYLDPMTRTILIGERAFPLERVHFYERAKMAVTHVKPAFVQDYTIGKRKK
jgi:hypothetical protein